MVSLPVIGFRIVLFALIWWLLTNGAINSWPIGLPAVLAATLLSVLLLPPTTWSLSGVLRFMPFFLLHSIRGGLDVAGRALHPRLPISPGRYTYAFRLAPGLPRVFMANAVSLLPGTLSVELEADNLHIHLLDINGAHALQLVALENQLAAIFGYESAAENTEVSVR